MNNNEVLKVSAFSDIPYAVLDEDLSSTVKNNFFSELGEIKEYYSIYDKGSDFVTEGSNLDYIPSSLNYKKIRKIINDEARFMFSQPLDIVINRDSNFSEIEKNQNTIINEFIKKVLKKNQFNSNILKASKDCFIGKRVAIVVNFDELTGIKINFLNALEFYYEMVGDNLTKFVAFFIDVESKNLNDKRIRKKTYEMENGYCYITEKLYDGSGKELEELFPRTKSLLECIPAWIVFNDGLVNDVKGESDVNHLIESEAYFSKLANGDIDALRKSMNPVKYAIDASSGSTSNLSSSPGSFWDIQSDENGVEQKKASVGQLESSMAYKDALSATLDRIDNQMHADMSVPNIDSEKLQGVITSGKTLKALYWPLTVSSDEKMQVWYAAVESIVDIIYTGALLYKESTKYYTNDTLPVIEIDVSVEANYALPEDEQEEKTIDLAEITAQTMSKKSYMKKWRGLTDEEADEELRQIALEREILEDSFSGMNSMSSDEETVIEESNNESYNDEQLDDEQIEE